MSLKSKPFSGPELIYVGDPMCSWCWGFAPVLENLKRQFGGRIDFIVRVGGLRPGDQAQPLDGPLRSMLRHHWEAVRHRSGQPFDYSFLDREKFLYDTEPSCRAVVTARSMDFSKTYDYFWKVQRAFYAQNQDPTDTAVLRQAAQSVGLDGSMFEEQFGSEAMRQATYEDFAQTRRWGVQGYPSVLLRYGDELSVLSRGFVEADVLTPRLESWLDGIKAGR